MMALARKIVSGEEDEAETVEKVFTQARDAEAASEEFLVDDGWKAIEPDPEAVGVNGRSTAATEPCFVVAPNGNGYDANGIGPTVELVPANGHAPAPVNGNGYDDEAPEPQRSLFSWAEFMAEEPVKPRGRSRKAQPASMSMFEWALSMEQEREKQTVGAGR